MPAGTPRGFNLQNFSMTGMSPMQGFGPSGGFPFFPGTPQGAAGWAGPDSRGGGPIRRGGRSYQNNARAGPYDRRPGSRQQGYGPDSGRLSPPPGSRRGGAAGGGGRWGDGAAGGAAVGPREAVQGRSIKSYEDLDAVA